MGQLRWHIYLYRKDSRSELAGRWTNEWEQREMGDVGISYFMQIETVDFLLLTVLLLCTNCMICNLHAEEVFFSLLFPGFHHYWYSFGSRVLFGLKRRFFMLRAPDGGAFMQTIDCHPREGHELQHGSAGHGSLKRVIKYKLMVSIAC